MEFYPLYSALADLYDMHGLSLNDDEFETYAFKALEFIGNFYGETVSEVFTITDYKIQLPRQGRARVSRRRAPAPETRCRYNFRKAWSRAQFQFSARPEHPSRRPRQGRPHRFWYSE